MTPYEATYEHANFRREIVIFYILAVELMQKNKQFS